jgi:hypothetical protein
MSQIHSKTKTSYYRRLYVAYLIDSGINTVPAIIESTGMPRRTAQDTITALSELDIQCVSLETAKNGKYSISSWGAIKKDWIKLNIQHVKDVLYYR